MKQRRSWYLCSAMSQSLELPDDLAAALAFEAARVGMSLPDYAVRLLASTRPAAPAVHTGADLVAFWQSEGLIGSRSDIADSSTHARELRRQAEQVKPSHVYP